MTDRKGVDVSEVTTVSLSDFLLARIAEDEAVARALDWMPRWVMAHDLVSAPTGVTEHIIRHDPRRVLAECEAKRRIVEFASEDEDAGFEANDAGVYARFILRHLATVYAENPDYREEWRP